VLWSTPRMNSIMKRWGGSCRRELLDRTLVGTRGWTRVKFQAGHAVWSSRSCQVMAAIGCGRRMALYRIGRECAEYFGVRLSTGAFRLHRLRT
jgi:hypothetical protein